MRTKAAQDFGSFVEMLDNRVFCFVFFSAVSGRQHLMGGESEGEFFFFFF